MPSANTRKPARTKTTKLTVPSRTDGWSPDNFALQWKPLPRGAGELTVVYEGPLARRAETVALRFGSWREGGQPWDEIQEIVLQREQPERFVGTLTFGEGAGLRAVELALRAGEGDWDNGGRAPLGYYEWRMGESRLTVVETA
jgi:hypothetical protein